MADVESAFYDNIEPIDDDDEFGPVPLADAYDDVDSEWDHDEIPLRWLFGKRGRGGLVEYAITAVVRDELVYLNQSSLADESGVSRHSVHRHIEDLVEMNIYKQYGGNGTVARFKPNKDSQVLRALYTANREVERYVSESL